MSDGLERSNLVIAKILKLAADHGISHWELSFSDLELDDSYATYFYPCLEWVEAEGLVRVGAYEKTLGGFAGGSAHDVSLTSRGMALLGQEVVVDGKRISLARAVVEESQGSGGTYRIGELIGGILGSAIKSMGS
ncbi:MAG: hypothetical protein ACXIU8_00760 [Alkalilacustris sp.]